MLAEVVPIVLGVELVQALAQRSVTGAGINEAGAPKMGRNDVGGLCEAALTGLQTVYNADPACDHGSQRET